MSTDMPVSAAGYRFDGPLATISDPTFFRCWMEDAGYVERLVQSADPVDTARKLVAVAFQRELARLIASGRIAEGIDDLLATFISDDYRQHDPHLADGRDSLAQFFRHADAAGVDLWPPMPVCVMNDGDVVALLLQGATDQGGERFIPTMFRVRGGLMTEHWSAAAPPPAPPAR
ncbi:hypothetical protein ACV229_25475 [Burkholderia sp. MR1-5-21]